MNLRINFSDGTSVIKETENPKVASKKSTKQNKKVPNTAQYLDTDADMSIPDQEIIKLPEIKEHKRTFNVAEELQNLDI